MTSSDIIRPQDPAAVDFEAEGLLDGLEDDEARAGRRRLLEQLLGDGASLAELKEAVREDRLALLPVERVLAGDRRYTLAELSERSGLEPEFLRNVNRALGVPTREEGEAAFSDHDLEAAQILGRLRDAGIPEEDLLENSRVLGQSLARFADAIRESVGRAFLHPGDSERDLGLRYAEAASQLAPLTGPLMQHVFNNQLRELVRNDVVGQAERASGRLPGAVDVVVAFADLVGFTRLGERLPAHELGGVAGRLASLAGEVFEPPVRLVKTIGDAVMFVSSDAAPLVEAGLALVEAAEREGEDFPQLRMGAACGSALNRGGDWYGRPVNLASRVTGIARPGTVLVTENVRELAGEGFSWSSAGRRKIKGIDKPIRLLRARPPGPA